MKRTIALLLLTAGLSSCGSADPTPEPAPKRMDIVQKPVPPRVP